MKGSECGIKLMMTLSKKKRDVMGKKYVLLY